MRKNLGFERLCEAVDFRIEPFQRRIVRAIGGPQPECAVLLPRGSGKTNLAAMVALHHFVTVEGAAIYLAASSRDQARVAFEAADGYARRLGHPNVVHRHLELRWCPNPAEPRVFDRHLRVLAADAPRLHGLTFSLAILDELQAFADDAVLVALASALHKRPGAKLLAISTAAQGADSPLGRLRTRALGQSEVKRSGAVTDASGSGLRLLEWSVSEDADVDDAETVKRANPASWVTTDQLAERRRALPDLAFRRYVANQWTEREGHWLGPGAWQRCLGQPEFEPGEDVWVGCDIGGERSATAVCWVNERLHVGCEIFHGDQGVVDAGDVVRELADRHRVREFVFDPWRAGQLAAELEREGLTTVAFPQNDARMIPASSTLHAAITEGRIVLPDHPELARHAANAIARHSRRGWRIDKPDARTHVDAIIALTMCVDRALAPAAKAELVGWL